MHVYLNACSFSSPLDFAVIIHLPLRNFTVYSLLHPWPGVIPFFLLKTSLSEILGLLEPSAFFAITLPWTRIFPLEISAHICALSCDVLVWIMCASEGSFPVPLTAL